MHKHLLYSGREAISSWRTLSKVQTQLHKFGYAAEVRDRKAFIYALTVTDAYKCLIPWHPSLTALAVMENMPVLLFRAGQIGGAGFSDGTNEAFSQICETHFKPVVEHMEICRAALDAYCSGDPTLREAAKP